MKKNKIINFLIIICMFLGLGTFTYFHDEAKIGRVEAASVVSNPKKSCIYLVDDDGLWKDATLVTLNITTLFDSNATPLIHYNNNVYYCELPKVFSITGGAWMSFSAQYSDGRSYTTPSHLAESGNGIFISDNNYDSVFILSSSGPGSYETTPMVSNKYYVYFAYNVEPGEKVFIKYNNGQDPNVFYEFPMIYTSVKWGETETIDGIYDVYRACIYSPTGTIDYLKFFVEDHTETELPNKSKTPIDVTTDKSVFDNHIYFLDHWELFRNETYKVTFNYMDGPTPEESNSDVITSDKNNKYTIKVPYPDNYPKSKWTFRRWYALDGPNNTPEYRDFHSGDTIVVTKNITYYAGYEPGTCIFVYVDISLFEERVVPGKKVTSFTLYYGEDNLNLYDEMSPIYTGSYVYEAIITLKNRNGKNARKVNSFRLDYTLEGDANTYSIDIPKLATKIDSNRNKLKYHIILPDEGKTGGYDVRVLRTIEYHYGLQNQYIYRRQPVSINTIHPLHFEVEGNTLEAMYYDSRFRKKFEPKVLTEDVTLYAKYSPARDYYVYIDNYQNREWTPTKVHLDNPYFFRNKKELNIPDSFVRHLGHSIYQLRLNVSKSYSTFYVEGLGNTPATSSTVYRTNDCTIKTEFTYFDITTNMTTLNEEQVNVVNTEIYGDCLVGAQKIPYETNQKNSFRFTIGIPSEINDYYQDNTDPTKPHDGSQTNLGFKVIFVQDGSCYIGFWNFKPEYRLDHVRLDKLYSKNVKYGAHTYNGFYSLTIRDDISFKYKDYDHIIIIGVYKNEQNKLQVVKATEYMIRARAEGHVDIYYQANHVIE